ncbi:hypothetical protein CERSUDRAFT_101604 [Gelatoporia subvermispora B]|uniref:Uncharacterized protein n=1 Tax=Ceriporiopsis subvermispora (strain B) TaxID=914234 RepID=M2QUV1_CERS8|nr:hypothetical protein CERSUDRAFT_101604 [Gelatoporia subvermispora B]
MDVTAEGLVGYELLLILGWDGFTTRGCGGQADENFNLCAGTPVDPWVLFPRVQLELRSAASRGVGPATVRCSRESSALQKLMQNKDMSESSTKVFLVHLDVLILGHVLMRRRFGTLH